MNRRPTPSIIDDVLTADATRPATIRNEAIKVDGGTQMRAQLDAATVTEYAESMADAGWGKFPPIIAYYDGTDYWLADGFHRLAAFRSLANYSDALIPADVRSGTRRDAILHAAGANASHGLRRTNADKRRAVETLLRDDEWTKWSNREIARRCAVDEGTVRKVRGDLERTAEIPQSDERHGADGRTTNTANIGAKPGPVPAPIPTPTARKYSAAVQAAQDAATVQVIEYEADAPPAPRIRGYNVLDDYALRDMPAPANAYDALAVPDGRISAARALIAMYREVIATEQQYGDLTGHFSDWLAPKRELSAMIGQLEHLIAIIEHPEEVSAAD